LTERNPRQAVIVGSGYIGLEMVDSLARLGLAVTLLEKMPLVCPGWNPDLAPHLHQHLENKAIQVITGQSARASSRTL